MSKGMNQSSQHIAGVLATAVSNIIPAALQEALLKKIDHFISILDQASMSSLACLFDKSEVLPEQLSRVFCCSDYFVEQVCRYPKHFISMLENNHIDEVAGGMAYAIDLRRATRACESQEDLAKVFREYRTQAMMRIIWRDLNRIAMTYETMREMSLLASACIDVGVDRLYRDACERYGTPIGLRTCNPVEMVVLGMGKLGGAELNLSSDIDLIFAYPDDGETDVSLLTKKGTRKPMSNHEFFSRLGKALIQLLDAVTAEGFVFRVDMRLRPYGASGPLVMSFDAMEAYYETQGREWERYAMIKAIPVAGDCESGQRLLANLKPFIYRRYLDFGAIQSLRDMKHLIEQEVVRRSMFDDIKLGAGGIREIEFVVQSFQLIYGGCNHQLQTPVLINALNGLLSEAYLDSTSVAQLKEAYVFFRDTEHALQAWRDEQTQRLPVNDPDAQIRLAFSMNYSDWALYYKTLDFHRKNVSAIFSDIIQQNADREPVATIGEKWIDFWKFNGGENDYTDMLESIGFDDPVLALRTIWQLRDSRKVNAMEAVSRSRLDKFMPMLLDAVAESESPDQALQRLIPFVETVLRRTAYLALLIENPAALKRLVRYFESSQWVSEQLTRFPALLDELLDTNQLATVPVLSELQSELNQQLLRIPEHDLEMGMEVLRHFKRGHGLRVAAAEIDGLIPLMRVSDYLSFVAEAVLNAVFDMAWAQLIERYGTPIREDGTACNRDFLIIAYGKLGGYELGHQSDLDLVFIYDAAAQGMTLGDKDVPGARSVENAVFFTRLGQRIIHILTTATTGGQLYEVDMRLRPSGSSGLLVSSFRAFSDYERDRAWTWEHQALTRSRVIAGSAELAKKFAELREDILCRQRDKTKLKSDVVDMRNKMREHLSQEDAPSDADFDEIDDTNASAMFELKHGLGGIVDIEFVVQYLVLAWSSEHTELVTWTDNMRLIDCLSDCKLLTLDEADSLKAAYTQYRSATHLAALRSEKPIVNAAVFAKNRRSVQAVWRRVFAQ